MTDTDEQRWKEAGRMLRTRRDQLGFSRRFLAKQAGLDASTLQTIEEGGKTVDGRWKLPPTTAVTLQKVLKVYRVGPDEWSAFAVGPPLDGAVLQPATASGVGEVSAPELTVSLSEPATRAELAEVRQAVERVESLLVELADVVQSLRPVD